MDIQEENLIVKVARALVTDAWRVLSMTPCHIAKVVKLLLRDNSFSDSEAVYLALRKLAYCFPNSVIVENEGSAGHFLVFYHVTALAAQFGWEVSPKTTRIRGTDRDLSLIDSMPYLEAMSESLRTLTMEPTAAEQARIHRIKERLPDIPLTLICGSDSYKKCLKSGRNDCQGKVHFERIVAPHSDPSLGDCSYLDTCFKGKQCKFVHYEIRYPSNWMKAKLLPQIESSPAQYINADLLQLDFSLLGSDYEAMIIDPPWDIHTNPLSGGCSDVDVLNLPVEKLQDAGVAFLWVTGRVLDLGRQCLQKWGYSHIEELIWLKTNQLGRTICTGRTGHWLNHTKEHVLVGTKGADRLNLPRMVDVDVLVSTALGKSQKPEELYALVNRLVGANAKKLELFGRKSNIRPGWLTIGNELGETVVHDPVLLHNLKLH